MIPRSTAFLAAFFATGCLGQQAPISASKAMVVSSEALATDAGIQILRKGGNAYDAAVAVGFALAVTYPVAGNIGGGGFFMGLPKRGGPTFCDFREMAPAGATKTLFLDSNGDIVPDSSLFSYKAAGVPGTVDGLIEVQKRFGKLTLQDDMRPAILLAERGFTVSKQFHDSLASELSRRPKIAETATIFYPNGAPLNEGDTLVQQDLAETLHRISDQGRQGFYDGPVARYIATEMERVGGLITQGDLKSYHAKWRNVMSVHFGDYELFMPSLPSSGGVTIAEILGMVDPTSLKSAGVNSAGYVQQLAESERLAYADRNYFLGDPDFVKVPVAELTSQRYLAKRKALIPSGHAGVSSSVGHGDPEKPETTHFCVVDSEGNVAAITYTLNGGYGMQAMVPGAGFLLNNEMDDFTSKPGAPNMFGLVQGDANSIQPHKRPLSSMTPTIILKNGKFFATIGSPGGSTIITTVLQTFLNMALFDMNVRAAVDEPRFHHQHLPDVVEYEREGLSADAISALERMGYKLRGVGSIGDCNAIMRMPDGSLQGWADRRNSAGKADGF